MGKFYKLVNMSCELESVWIELIVVETENWKLKIL